MRQNPLRLGFYKYRNINIRTKPMQLIYNEVFEKEMSHR
jgi:hypothetical protein